MLLRSIKGMPISRFLTAFSIVLATLSMVVVVTYEVALRDLQIGGHRYQRIVAGKDVLADVKPQPLSTLETYLVLTAIHGARTAAEARPLVERFRALEAAYRDRLGFWARQELSPQVRDLLLQAADRPAQALF